MGWHVPAVCVLIMALLTTDDIADMRADIAETLTDTCVVMNLHTQAAKAPAVAPSPSPGYPDGRGGFTTTNPLTDNRGGSKDIYTDGATYPCRLQILRLRVGKGEQLQDARNTEVEENIVKLPFNAIVMASDRLRVSTANYPGKSRTFNVLQVSEISDQFTLTVEVEEVK